MQTQDEVTELIGQLEAVLAAIASGALPAEPDQVAWLRGVVVGLRSVAE